MYSILLESLRILNQEFDGMVIEELKKYGVQLPEDVSRVDLVRQVTRDEGVEPVLKCYVDGKLAFDIYQTTHRFFKGGFCGLEKKYTVANRQADRNQFENFIRTRFERKE